MSKAKTKKFNIFLYLIVLICVFVMFIICAYAYYKKSSQIEDRKIIHNNLLMSLNFNGKDQFNVVNIKPGYQETIEFSITNFTEDTIGNYKLVFEIITPLSNMSDEKFTYTLEGTSESKDNTNNVINNDNIVVPVVSKELEGGCITPKNTHNYKMTVKLDKQVNANKYPKGSMFSARIKMVSENN